MSVRNIVLATVFLLLSVHMGKSALIHGLLESLALPRIAELTHTSASSAALAAGAAYNEYKTYVGDFHSGVKGTFKDHFHFPKHAGLGPAVLPEESASMIERKSARKLLHSKSGRKGLEKVILEE